VTKVFSFSGGSGKVLPFCRGKDFFVRQGCPRGYPEGSRSPGGVSFDLKWKPFCSIKVIKIGPYAPITGIIKTNWAKKVLHSSVWQEVFSKVNHQKGC